MEWQKEDLSAEVEDLELVLEKQHDLDDLRTQTRQAKKELHKLKMAKNRMMEEMYNSFPSENSTHGFKELETLFGGGIHA
jgi:hypothetical protein